MPLSQQESPLPLDDAEQADSPPSPSVESDDSDDDHAGGSCGEEFGESQNPNENDDEGSDRDSTTQKMVPNENDDEEHDRDSNISKTTLALGEASGGEGDHLDCPGEGGESENESVEDPVVPPEQSDDESSSDWEEEAMKDPRAWMFDSPFQGNSRWPKSHYDNHIRGVLMNFWDSGKKSWCTSHVLWPEYINHCEWSFAHFGPPVVGWLSTSKHFQLWLDHYMAQEN